MGKTIKKTVVLILLFMAALLAAAVVYGVLNALIGGGSWSFGWRDYRYDESGFQVGEGTVRADGITAIDVDWIDGAVEIVSCRDSYISLTETSPGKLSAASELRWRVDESGRLTVKYRKSSWIFGFSARDKDKKLVLRVPEELFDGLQEVKVNALSSTVTVRGIRGNALTVETESGSVGLENTVFSACTVKTEKGDVGAEAAECGNLTVESLEGGVYMKLASCPAEADLQTNRGHVNLYLPADASFYLLFDSESGRFSNDFGLNEGNADEKGGYLCGTGENALRVKTVSGNLVLGLLRE